MLGSFGKRHSILEHAPLGGRGGSEKAISALMLSIQPEYYWHRASFYCIKTRTIIPGFRRRVRKSVFGSKFWSVAVVVVVLEMEATLVVCYGVGVNIILVVLSVCQQRNVMQHGWGTGDALSYSLSTIPLFLSQHSIVCLDIKVRGSQRY